MIQYTDSGALLRKMWLLVDLWTDKLDDDYHPEDYLYNAEHAIVLKAVLQGRDPDQVVAELDRFVQELDSPVGRTDAIAVLDHFRWKHPYKDEPYVGRHVRA